VAITDPTFVAGDGLSVLEVAFKKPDGGAQDLTGLISKLVFTVVDRASPPVEIQAPATVVMDNVVPLTDGKATYQFSASELLGGTPNELVGGRLQWEAYVSDGAAVLTSRLEGEEELRGRISAPVP
jgi:hypothetical protein